MAEIHSYRFECDEKYVVATTDYGQQITNVIDQNDQCYTPIVKKCSVLTTGQPSADTNCRYYDLRCIKKNNNSSFARYGNSRRKGIKRVA